MITPPIIVLLDNHAVFSSTEAAASYHEPWQLDNLFAIDSKGNVLQFTQKGLGVDLTAVSPPVQNTVLLVDILYGLLISYGFTIDELDKVDLDDLLKLATKLIVE